MFIPPRLVEVAHANAQRWPWAAQAQAAIVQAAAPFLAMSDEDLWSLMFGPTITRSWMVWSDGHCPACRGDVRMYNWKIDPLAAPWKLACPNCGDLFPKNDFAAFYRSGLDNRAVFDPARADRRLLFNAQHPDKADPLHAFGVDDGEGYVADGHRWRFIGAYLIYGQWKQLVVGGTRNLAAAYVVTGDARYAHKAGVILDRVADLYPSFDHIKQAWVYETMRTEGYVSTWHDACEETREMALAYDYVRPALKEDRELAGFLARHAKAIGHANPKAAPADVCRNIEAGLLRDPIVNRQRIHSNYPRREIALATIHRVLDTPQDRERFDQIVDAMLKQATCIDGVTGEKGLAGYSAYVINALGHFLAQLERLEPGTTKKLIARCPALARTFRFHIDTWCDQTFYPHVGDDGFFAAPVKGYAGVHFARSPSIEPSVFEFFLALYHATGDAAYVQVLFHANGSKPDDLPRDLFAADPEGFRREVADLIARHGQTPKVGSIDFRQWHLAILRTGAAASRTHLWLHYARDGAHGHHDPLNLGLFAKGLDLMPDLGYPPVQYGGWSSPRADWYRKAASHNTVVIDGKDVPTSWHHQVGGKSTLWADGQAFRAVAAGGAALARANVMPEEIEISGPARQRISLYAWTPATFERVEVYTRPEDARDDAPWTLAFADDFARDALGPDWANPEGEWQIQAGKLVGKGELVCNRPFPGRQRVVAIASSNHEQPVDLSLGLAGDASPVKAGLFFAFGTADGKTTAIRHHGRELIAGSGAIRRGQRHRVEACRDGRVLTLNVDGVELLRFQADAASMAAVVKRTAGGYQFHRTCALINLSDRDAYVLDVFHVAGGKDHAKFQHSGYGALDTGPLKLAPSEEFGDQTQMRNFKTDPAPPRDWTAQFALDDRNELLPPGSRVFLRYTDMTRHAQATTCEGWATEGSYNTSVEAWFPRLMIRRKSGDGAPLASAFVALLEPHEGQSAVASTRRLDLATPDGRPYGDAQVGVEVTLRDGRTDLLLLACDENAQDVTPWPGRDGGLVEPQRRLKLDAGLAWLRLDAKGKPQRLALANATAFDAPGLQVRLKPGARFVEIDLQATPPRVVAGEAQAVATLRVD